ncbi:MAG TPA: flagellar biosynthetic protein FliR [Limnobacter sp.]|uniref:EscT/YscT/HrcT family type III secretion system export apparatus protein n=1 Tax=Limnobacter sp. TaxID=2003368 RepID=UPI002EDBAAD5
MLEQLKGALGYGPDLVYALYWFLPRILIICLLLPVFSRSYSSWLIRIAVATSFALLPAMFYGQSVDNTDFRSLGNLTQILGECTLGLFMGLMFSLPYYSFRILGNIVDNLRGANFAAQAGVGGGDSGEQLPFEEFLALYYVTLFMTGSYLVFIVQSIYTSFIELPPGHADLQAYINWAIGMIDPLARYMVLAILLAAPFFILSIALEVAMSLISVFAQNMQVYSLQYSVKGLMGLVVAFFILSQMGDELVKLTNEHLTLLTRFFWNVSVQ